MDDSGPELPPDSEAVRATLRRDIAILLPDLRGFARFLVRDRVAADDLVQDAIVRGLSALDQFRPGTNLKAWLFTILRNAFYETARRRRREARSLEHSDLTDRVNQPDAEARAELRDLETMIWTLPPLLREAVILVGAQELSYEEAAAVCNVPIGTIKARVSRARTALAVAAQRTAGRTERGHDAGDT